MDYVHRVNRNAQTGRHHLRKRGLMALTVAVRAGENRDAASGMDTDLAALKQTGTRTQSAGDIAGRDTAGFDVAGVANAAQQAFGCTGCFAGRVTGGVAQDLGFVHAGAVVADVVLQCHRGLVGPAVDEIAFADFVLGDAQFPTAAADQTLEQIGRLGATGTAVGVHRRGVGEPGVHLDIDLRAGVLAGQQGCVKDGGNCRREGRQIRTQVGVGVHPHGQELAVFVHRHFGVADVVTAMGVGQERLGTLASPLDAAVDLFGSPGQGHIFGVQVNLGAETAAHVGCDHAHFVLGQAQHKSRHQQALDVRVLVGDIQHIFFGGAAVVANGDARLHGVGNQAVVDQVQLGHMGCSGECRVHLAFVAQGPFKAMVIGGGIVQLRAFGGVTHVDHCGQHVVIHDHCLGGVLGLLEAVSNHHGNLVTDVTRLTECQHRVRWLFHGAAVGVVDQPAAGQSAHLAFEVLADKDFDDAGHFFCRADVNALDVGVRMRTAHEDGVALRLHRDVVGVVARTSQKAVVLFAAQGFADVGKLGKI